ncbi:hypothetical protein niasHT_017097 [Heterodera trifolii]|uniref:Uncharacterized protein n=1 Tax=Heterodera trifolii TaxID=157864 RepID=A0ABD2KY24_9BILA
MRTVTSLKHSSKKSALCNIWLLHGHCPRAETCLYAHGINDLRLSLIELENFSSSNKNKDNGSNCRFFQRGECLRGDECKFVHETPSSSEIGNGQRPFFGDEHRKEHKNVRKWRGALSRSSSNHEEDEEDTLSNWMEKIRIGGGAREADEGRIVRLMVLTLDKSSGLFFKIARSKPLGVLRLKIAERLNIEQNEIGLLFNAKMVTDNQTADELELRDNDCLQSISIDNCLEEL